MSGGPERSEFITSDLAEARELLDRHYGARLRVGRTRSPKPIRVSRVKAGGIDTGEVLLPPRLEFELKGRSEYVFTTLLGGRVRYGRDEESRFGPGDLYLAADPEREGEAETEGVHARTFSLPAMLLSQVASQNPERPIGPVRFSSHRPVAGGARRWRAAIAVFDAVLADPRTDATSLAIGPAARLLAATALAVFPNDAVEPSRRADRRDGHTETVRRAIAYIESNPRGDVAVADIALAASVTVRAVQLAFRRHLDTTPMAYLRQVRLQHAHNQLVFAGPGDGLTVTQVALDWGFANPSRFAAHYRSAYVRAPSETLAG